MGRKQRASLGKELIPDITVGERWTETTIAGKRRPRALSKKEKGAYARGEQTVATRTVTPQEAEYIRNLRTPTFVADDIDDDEENHDDDYTPDYITNSTPITREIENEIRLLQELTGLTAQDMFGDGEDRPDDASEWKKRKVREANQWSSRYQALAPWVARAKSGYIPEESTCSHCNAPATFRCEQCSMHQQTVRC